MEHRFVGVGSGIMKIVVAVMMQALGLEYSIIQATVPQAWVVGFYVVLQSLVGSILIKSGSGDVKSKS